MRVIPRIDVRNDRVIKGIHLEGVRKVGFPNEMALKYAAEGADEILFMDVVASLYGRNSLLPVIEEAAKDIFVPLTVGGGIRTVDDIVQVLRSGADKVAINTAAIERPAFLEEAAKALGSQCIVVSIEAKRTGAGWEAMTHNGRQHTARDAVEWAAEAEHRGAGEILITSIDQEGTMAGFDLDLFERVHDKVLIPVIGCGGAGNAAHVAEAARRHCVDAVCCASIFHFDKAPIPTVKKALADVGAAVRP